MYIKLYKPEDKHYTIRYLCCTVDGEEIVLGWIDRFNNLHSK